MQDNMYYRRLSQEPTVYLTADQFLQEACAYFAWCEDCPLIEEKINFYQGDGSHGDVSKMRPFTMKGLATFMGMTVAKLDGYKRQAIFAPVLEMLEQVIYTQKFEGAAAGLLNASLITRDLGLAERTELSGPDGGPIKTEETGSALDVLSSKLAGLAARAAAVGDPEQPNAGAAGGAPVGLAVLGTSTTDGAGG